MTCARVMSAPANVLFLGSCFVACAQQWRIEARIDAPEMGNKGNLGLANPVKSRHGSAMFDARAILVARTWAHRIALTMVTMLVAASTLVPSLSYAHKYADHLSLYGGADAKIATLTGFAKLYVSPRAPMLPVTLTAPSDADMATLLPSPCSIDKTVLPRVAHHSLPSNAGVNSYVQETYPVGLDPSALRGPPRQNA